MGNWPQVIARGAAPLHSPLSTPSSSSQAPSLSSSQFQSPSSSSSSQVLSPFTPSLPQALSPFQLWQQQQQYAANQGLFNPTPETIAGNIPPFISQQSFPFQQYLPNPVQSQILPSIPRKSKDDAGKIQAPGLKDLPPAIQLNFRNSFIRHMMKLTFSGILPWKNPSLSVYQEEFNTIYPIFSYRLHADDAVVFPVSTHRS